MSSHHRQLGAPTPTDQLGTKLTWHSTTLIQECSAKSHVVWCRSSKRVSLAGVPIDLPCTLKSIAATSSRDKSTTNRRMHADGREPYQARNTSRHTCTSSTHRQACQRVKAKDYISKRHKAETCWLPQKCDQCQQ